MSYKTRFIIVGDHGIYLRNAHGAQNTQRSLMVTIRHWLASTAEQAYVSRLSDGRIMVESYTAEGARVADRAIKHWLNMTGYTIDQWSGASWRTAIAQTAKTASLKQYRAARQAHAAVAAERAEWGRTTSVEDRN